jgi:hypothetical protein
MNMDRRYISYLLRLWMVKENDTFVWRASLETTHSGERYGFASLDAMLAFLKEQTQSSDKDSTLTETTDE